jgi:hypothetical protein
LLRILKSLKTLSYNPFQVEPQDILVGDPTAFQPYALPIVPEVGATYVPLGSGKESFDHLADNIRTRSAGLN